MQNTTRREFVQTAVASVAAAGLGYMAADVSAQVQGERPRQDEGVRVLNPQARVPVSMIIDDSTCLVNLAHFAMPQFAEVWPGRKEYQKPWQQATIAQRGSPIARSQTRHLDPQQDRADRLFRSTQGKLAA